MEKGILLNRWRYGLCFLFWKNNPQNALCYIWLTPSQGPLGWQYGLTPSRAMTRWSSLSLSGDKLYQHIVKDTSFMCPLCIPRDKGHLWMKTQWNQQAHSISTCTAQVRTMVTWIDYASRHSYPSTPWDLVQNQDSLTPAYQAKEPGNVCRVSAT